MYELKEGTILKNGSYRIVKKLSQGGFGITYLAEHTALHSKVAIKEFFMKDYCSREEATKTITMNSQGNTELVQRFRDKFRKEALTIAQMNDTHIIRVTDVFDERETSYYVMDYIEDGTLQDKINDMGCMSLPMASRYIKQVASALDYLHRRKYNHLDIKPSNIMINMNDEVVLIDFGVSKQYDIQNDEQTSSTPVPVSNGYSPIEQYTPDGVKNFSPESDIYALGATFYKLLTGITPPPAVSIIENGVSTSPLKEKGIPQNIIKLIVKAMSPSKNNRTKSVAEFLDILEDGPTTEKHINWTIISLVTIIVVLGTVTFFFTPTGKIVIKSIGNYLTELVGEDTTFVHKDTIVIKEETPKDTVVIVKHVGQDKYEPAPTPIIDEDPYDWLSEECNYKDFDNYNKDELRILRNAIYARHGYKFKDPELTEYFSRFKWYIPSYNNVQLTDTEKYNVDLIQAHEEILKQ